MERRKHARKNVKNLSVKAKLVIAGESLLKQEHPHTVEIDAMALNVSQTGICLFLDTRATWNTITPNHELTISFPEMNLQKTIRGKVVHVLERGRVLGLQFSSPVGELYDELMERHSEDLTFS